LTRITVGDGIVQYGSIVCGVFKKEIQNQIVFCIK
jgi:hypothetical protein